MNIERGVPESCSSSASECRTQVAVYGTLKRGFSNHHIMGEAQFLGEDILKQITLYDLGPYPGAVLVDSHGIEVEVFSLNTSQLTLLDMLEEYDQEDPADSLYTRMQLVTRFGPAWVYLYQGKVEGHRRLESGSWSESVLAIKESRS